MAGWSTEETRALLGIWGDADVQSKLDDVVRNKAIYQKVAGELRSLGYERTWEQCRTKIKNVVKKYRKVKDSNSVSGRGRITCPFYDELDAILGSRVASSPQVVLDSGGGETEGPVIALHSSEEGEESALQPGIHESGLHNSSGNTDTDNLDVSSNATAPSDADCVIPDGDPNSAPLTPSSSGATDSAGQGMGKRDAITDRKRGKGQKRKANSLVEELCLALDKAEERAAERELRMRKLELEMEAEMREREDQRDERMMNMLSTIMLQLAGVRPGPSNPVAQFPYPPYPPSSYPPQPPFSEPPPQYPNSATSLFPSNSSPVFPQ